VWPFGDALAPDMGVDEVETPETEVHEGAGGEGALGVASPRLVDSVVDALVITDATG